MANARSISVSPARPVLRLYRQAPLAVRVHVRVRWATCPLQAVAAAVPREGRVLEVGCGHGLLANYLALESPERDVHGIDIDGPKIDAARAAAEVAGWGTEFTAPPPGRLPDGPWDAIVIVDVLYLLTEDQQRALLATCAAALGPGGVLVVKEMSPAPRWKSGWNRVQETLAVRVLGITEGEGGFTFIPPEQLAAWMADDGLAATHRPLHKGYPHPHHLLVGRAREAGA
jgi:2-polyprenyl-3-methyl-5-hydroxy-6-metoxy-1,4-benzoquinol methylase